MSPVEAAATIREAVKTDPVLRRAVGSLTHRSGFSDVYEWCDANPTEAVALAESLVDIDGQVANMQYLLDNGDLS
jgi:hypothetical protein